MKNLKNIFLALAVFAAAWLVYSNTMGNPFLYDDMALIQENKTLDDMSNLAHLFDKTYFKISGERSYRPVSTAAFFAAAAFDGRTPRAFRVTSVLAHSLCCVAIFALVLLLCGRSVVAFTTALIFAAHPIHSEAVNAMSFIEDPLSAMFFFFAFAAYIAARRKGSVPMGAASLVLSMLAMFAKEGAAILPLCLTAYEWILSSPAEAGNRAAVKSRKLLAAHFGALLFFVIIRFVVITHPSPTAAAGYPGAGPVQAFYFMAGAFIKYLWLFVFPYGFSVEHCINAAVLPQAWVVVVSVIVHCALAAFAAAVLRVNRLMSFATVFYILNLLPISNIIPFGAVMAERYIYLPSFGLCLLLAILFLDENEDRRVMGIKIAAINVFFLLSVAGFMGMLTFQRNRDWSDGLTLWGKAVQVCPDSSRARNNYARRLVEAGDYAQAADQLEQAVKIHPENYEAWTSLGVARFNLGDYQGALRAYKEALDMHPSNDVRYNIAILQLRAGRPALAVPVLERMLAAQPDWPAAHYLLGNAHLRLGNLGQAEREFRETLRLDPAFSDAKGNLGIVYMKSGRLDEAASLFREILNVDPASDIARKNLDIINNRKIEMEK